MRLGFFSSSIVVLASLALGCEEPVPPTPQGAFVVNFQQTPGCPHKSHQSVMGSISATERTTLLVDGIKNADITCTVKGADLGPFSVDASIVFEGTEQLYVNVAKIDSKATEAMPAQGNVAFSSFITGEPFSSNQPCNFFIAPAGPSGKGQGVAPGTAWLSFSCPSLVESNNTCALAESYFIVENCTP